MSNSKPVSTLHCPLCASSTARTLAEINSFGYMTRYYLCRACGFVYQNPAESRSADPDFYEQTYRRLYQATEEPTAKDLHQQHLRAENQLSYIHEHGVCRIGLALDIGASSGILMETLHEAYNAEVLGVEPGNAYRGLAESKGFRLYPSLEQLLADKPERFDFVSMMHVLEHLEDPLGTLVNIREHLLDENGFLLLEVPNFYAHDSYELAHLSCFTEHTLTEMLRKAGYKIMNLRKHGYPRSKTLDLYIGVLARPQTRPELDDKVKTERFVAQKRMLGMLKRNVLTRIKPAETWLPVEEA